MDVKIIDQGSLIGLRSVTEKGNDWIEANISSEPYQWLGGVLWIGHRFVDDIAIGMLEDDLILG